MHKQLELRDYQQALVDGVEAAWTRHRRVLAWLPTGGGKTEIAVHLAQNEEQHNGVTLFVVDRKTLAKQAHKRFTDYGMLTGLIRGEATHLRGFEPVYVASIQSLGKRSDDEHIKRALERVTLIVVDEAHILFKAHTKLVESLLTAKVLGLSATPLRDGLALNYDEMVRGPNYEDLMTRGHLVKPRYFLPHADDLRDAIADVAVASTGDFVQGALSKAMRERTLVGDLVDTWQSKAADRPTIVFCVDIAHSKSVCDSFAAVGVSTEHIDMRTPEDERSEMFERFRRGETRVLCSILTLGIGFDQPSASCAVLARPTLSLSLHIQQVGRALRTHSTKTDALILDHAGNVLRHGRVEEFEPPELSSIDKRTDRKSREHTSDDHPCGNCRALMRAGQRVCPECGHEIARQTDVHHVHGELVEPDQDRELTTQDTWLSLYRQLRHIGESRGYKDGWAYIKLKEKYGFQAPYGWKHFVPEVPTQKTRNLVRSWAIAYRKSQRKHQHTH